MYHSKNKSLENGKPYLNITTYTIHCHCGRIDTRMKSHHVWCRSINVVNPTREYYWNIDMLQHKNKLINSLHDQEHNINRNFGYEHEQTTQPQQFFS